MSLVAWRDACLPRCEGGLGIKQIKIWNQAAMTKHLWKVHASTDDLWVRWSKGKLRNLSIWAIMIPQDCPWSWRKILRLRNQVKNFMSMQLGDGRQCSLFYDIWCGNEKLCDRIPDTESWGSSVLKVADWKIRNEWHIPHSFMRRHPQIAEEMRQVRGSSEPDKPMWNVGESELFTISNCYNTMRRIVPKVTWDRVVWSTSSLPRHAFMLWLAIRGRLKTRQFLSNRGMVLVDQCGLLGETVDHLFFHCVVAKEVWKEILLRVGINHNPLRWAFEWNWVKRKCKGRSRVAKVMSCAIAATLYFLWRERNKRIFQSKMLSIPRDRKSVV